MSKLVKQVESESQERQLLQPRRHQFSSLQHKKSQKNLLNTIQEDGIDIEKCNQSDIRSKKAVDEHNDQS